MKNSPDRPKVTIDGNEAAAYIAHRTNEVIAIYPITPSSNMGEACDEYTAKGIANIWGTVPTVIEMQSEGGAAGAVHGALQAGSLTTTFTSSQGLLLMIPNMYKIAGELTSTVFHIAARSIAAQGLSIFGDHQDVMACRQTGWAMLFSNSVQEVMDFALISQAATLEARIPFLHAFDGFRTSHAVEKIERLADSDILAMMDDRLISAHRARALSPERPVLRGTAQNPDVYFQARESVNRYYDAVPGIVQAQMDKLAALTGRQYHLFDYAGSPDATEVVVLSGSGADTAEATVEHLVKEGRKVGVLKVRLFRPFSTAAFLAALPKTVKTLSVLDRTKEPGSLGEPLYQEVLTALSEAHEAGQSPFAAMPRIVAGRYGLSSKEFTPAMIKSVLDEAARPTPKKHFTIGINDDVSRLSLAWDPAFSIESPDSVRAVFWGLGSDGTVGANKNSVKIIGETTDNHAQGYFVYDSKKAGAVTVSHLRFGKDRIRHNYLISRASFVAVHQFGFIYKFPVLEAAEENAVFLLNSPYGPDLVWKELPRVMQEEIIAKKIRFYVIDAYKVAAEAKMGVRVNTIMQTCFFQISGVLPPEVAIAKIKDAIKKTYGKRGEAVLQQNYNAVDMAVSNLHQVSVPASPDSALELPPVVPVEAPSFVQQVTAELMAGRGDLLPVSALPDDGTWPTGTAQWERRNIALEVPVWEPDLCIQCGKCVLVCPHATIRAKLFDAPVLDNCPATFKSMGARWREMKDKKYSIQVAVEDCTGCRLCVEVCPAKDKSQAGRKALNMAPQRPLREQEIVNWDFFQKIPELPRQDSLVWNTVNNVQVLQPLFEFSGACAGCGETPYIKLATQLFGDRMLIANATGCSSIYGGNLPTTPYTKTLDGRGPAWSNSLFEDNAEFGLGLRLAVDSQATQAHNLLKRLSASLGQDLVDALINADQSSEAGILTQRERVAALKEKLATIKDADATRLLAVSDALVKKSVWIIGGDGWAYDIGFGGLDHVMASGRNVNILVLDTEVYSNTGGQASKSTPIGAVAKFAAGGKAIGKKDLGMIAMSYGNVYVASVAMGASDAQTVRTFIEAEAHPGPSIIIAYSHCIAHGIDMAKGLVQQKKAVDCGHWTLYRYNPALALAGKNPLQLDSRAPSIPVKDYIYNETRYTMLTKSAPQDAARYLEMAQAGVQHRWQQYSQLAQKGAGETAPPAAPTATEKGTK